MLGVQTFERMTLSKECMSIADADFHPLVDIPFREMTNCHLVDWERTFGSEESIVMVMVVMMVVLMEVGVEAAVSTSFYSDFDCEYLYIADGRTRSSWLWDYLLLVDIVLHIHRSTIRIYWIPRFLIYSHLYF